jgi:spermidine synthase
MCRCPISQHVFPIHCAICFWISSYLKESWNFRYGTPSKNHKLEIPIVVRKQYEVSGNEIKMTLED